MGLYDSYQLKNSREIPQYAGSALPELTKSLELAQQTYDSASTMDQDLAQTVLGTSVLDQDKETWNALNNKTQAELRDRITKGDYENMYGIVSQRARKTIAALKPLAEQIQRRSSYQQTLDDKELNLDESTKTALKEQSDRKYTGVKFDEQGRAIEGTQYSGLGAVKNIDVNDRIRKAITIANPDAEKVERSGDNGWQTWSRERGWEKLSPKKLANIVNQAYANDTEWQQSDEQKINTSTFHATKHVSDAMVLNFMKANSGTDVAKDLMDKITAGKSPADAYADIQSAAIRKKIVNSRLGYGMGAEFYKGTDKQGSGIGAYALADYNKKLTEEDAITALGATEDFERNTQTLEGLNQETEKVNTAIADATTRKASLETQLRDLPATDVVGKAKLQQQLTATVAEIAQTNRRKAQLDNIFEQNLDDASRQRLGKGYNEIKKGIDTHLNTIFTRAENTSVPTTELRTQGEAGATELKAENTTFGEIKNQIKNGTATVENKKGHLTVTLADGRVAKMNTQNLSAAEALVNTLHNDKLVRNDVKHNYKPKGVISSNVTIDKNMWNEIMKVIPTSGLTDAQGNQADIPEDVDWSKTQGGLYNTTANNLPVTLYKSDGTKAGEYRIDMSKNDARMILGKKLATKGSTLQLKRLGADMLTQLPQWAQTEVLRNSYVSTTEGGKQLVTVDHTGAPVKSILIRDTNNNWIMANAITGDILKDGSGNAMSTQSLSKAGEWLNEAHHNATK